MKLAKKVAALLKYIAYNPQPVYLKSKLGYEAQNELQDISQALANGTVETDIVLLARYRKAVDHLVKNYFSTDFFSPLMYAAKKDLIDLMEDLLATPGIDIDEQYNHRLSVRTKERQFLFGSSEWVTVVQDGPQKGYTALVFALKFSAQAAADLLLKRYANPLQPLDRRSEETIIDLFDEKHELQNHAFLETAWLLQANFLVEELIDCPTEVRLNAIIDTQKRLAIKKADMIDALIYFYPDNQVTQIRVLEQATDFDDFKQAQNFLAEYVRKSQGITGGTDDDALKTVNDKLTALTTSRDEKHEDVVAAPTIPAHSSAPRRPLIIQLKYGPQNPIHPRTAETHPEFMTSYCNANL